MTIDSSERDKYVRLGTCPASRTDLRNHCTYAPHPITVNERRMLGLIGEFTYVLALYSNESVLY